MNEYTTDQLVTLLRQIEHNTSSDGYYLDPADTNAAADRLAEMRSLQIRYEGLQDALRDAEGEVERHADEMLNLEGRYRERLAAAHVVRRQLAQDLAELKLITTPIGMPQLMLRIAEHLAASAALDKQTNGGGLLDSKGSGSPLNDY